LSTAADPQPLQELERGLVTALGSIVLGAERSARALAIALVARGHVLIQGAPGLGKTLLAKTLARVLGGSFRRIQGTPDLMPSDITGVHVFDERTRDFVFHPGPIFADVLLVDEINRAGPKTQAALLEAMEERHVTLERETFALPKDFLVIATQNPREFEGTYPLPESQLDRFMLRVEVDYPDAVTERAILDRYGGILSRQTDEPGTYAQLLPGALEAARAAADAVFVAPALQDYALALVHGSRAHARIALGVSTRGALALVKAARIAAGLRGATFAAPEDVKTVAPWVMTHRLLLSPEAMLDEVGAADVVAQLLADTPVPR